MPVQMPGLLKRETVTRHLVVAVLGLERRKRKENNLYLGSYHRMDLGK